MRQQILHAKSIHHRMSRTAIFTFFSCIRKQGKRNQPRYIQEGILDSDLQHNKIFSLPDLCGWWLSSRLDHHGSSTVALLSHTCPVMYPLLEPHRVDRTTTHKSINTVTTLILLIYLGSNSIKETIRSFNYSTL